MRNTLGNVLTLTLFGESHGPFVGAVIDGLPGGIKIDEEYIKECLSKRRPSYKGETPRVESDEYIIMSGVFNGYSNGEPLTIAIKNSSFKSEDYSSWNGILRPSHADYVAHVKHDGYEDYRGGGHFSGRITAAIVAAGAIIEKALENKGIQVGAHIANLGEAKDSRFNPLDPLSQIKELSSKNIPVLSLDENEISFIMAETAEKGDSVGGSVEVAITNLPVGLGEGWFSSLDGSLANAMLSIGGVKGIEFGIGFEFASSYGSKVNDAFALQNGKIVTSSNNGGGINGGMSNGMPVIFTVAVKPTPSISLPQNSVNVKTMEESELLIGGRHDPCIVRRIVPVIKAMTSFVIADMMMLQFGREALK